MTMDLESCPLETRAWSFVICQQVHLRIPSVALPATLLHASRLPKSVSRYPYWLPLSSSYFHFLPQLSQHIPLSVLLLTSALAHTAVREIFLSQRCGHVISLPKALQWFHISYKLQIPRLSYKALQNWTHIFSSVSHTLPFGLYALVTLNLFKSWIRGWTSWGAHPTGAH